MLRLLVLTLTLCNGIYFAWSQGLLPGMDRESQAESFRLGQQIRVQALRPLSERELALVEKPAKAAPKSVECLQAGLFDNAQGAVLRSELTLALPPDSWSLHPVAAPERWLIYLGKYADNDLLAKKRAQLTKMNLRFETVTNPALRFGLSLGHFDSEEAASTALADLAKRGVRSARVLQDQPAASGMMLRLPAVDDALRSRLDALKPALANKPLLPCR